MSEALSMTVDEMMACHPCEEYSRERLEELWAGRESLSALDILALDIPDADKLWGVLREQLIPAPVLHELACRFAEAALIREREASREPDPRSWAAIEAKRAWLRGEITDEQLQATGAAWAAWAAWEAAREAAGEAAGEAAWEAAGAAWEAAGAEQVEMVKRILQEVNTHE
jgi:hypothetical protein